MELTPKTQQELSLVKYLDSSFRRGVVQEKTNLVCDTKFAGKGKKFDRPIPKKGGYTFGEDSIWTECLEIGKDLRLHFMMVCDGHGVKGDQASRQVISWFQERLLSPYFIRSCRNLPKKEYQRIFILLQHIFSEVEDQFKMTGGTTVSLAIVVSIDNRHFLITANVGDSPILLLPTHSSKYTFLASKSHSWDNQEERTKYLEFCKRHGLEPRDVILGRFNTPTGSLIPRKDGSIRPWFLFKPGTDEIDHDTLHEFHEVLYKSNKSFVFGGIQSQRKLVLQHRETKQIFPYQPYYHENWGSTGFDGESGRTQMTRSIGDLEAKRDLYMRSDPDFLIHEFEPEESESVFHLLLCSDGFSDLFYFHEFKELLSPYTHLSTSDKIKVLFHELFKRGDHIDYGFDKSDRPLWDDCCIILSTLRFSKRV
jgi:serine/threonine protein phosphatase PrpC